jgi:fatty acid desaturase
VKKLLVYLGCISEIIVSIGVFVAFLASFPYFIDGMVAQNVLQAHGWDHLLVWSPAVLFIGIFILCGSSFGRALNRLRKSLASESARTKLLLVVITFPIAEVGIVTWIWIFGHGLWRIPGIIFVSVLMFAVILDSIHDYKEAKTKKGKELN